MAEVVLFHHVQGLTPGVRALADAVRAAGHTVHTPDFFDGATYESIEEGFAAVKARGEGARDRWADEVADGVPAEVVWAGISLGVMAAQRLAQTRPGARGAVLLEAFAPPEAFGGAWPSGLPVQVHGMEQDPFFGLEGDLEAARTLVGSTDDAELFTYPGDVHLFTDASLPTSDPAATDLVLERVVRFLGRVDGALA